ncbi:glycine betaine ABC transporter substrate-binding protein [Paramicrobacterium agarici]|uniref:Glycine betaine/proline transport system substrate-binding protein n=1 Tax=Paramicrobacterium agarici TaxID=630514 RepID=A0A2A9DTW0_9MICO|nr:glycine betaine ABC transporter substrate-binding protein [Microbacterium agarici]PFG30227.1 glycine betaine/proline transport system substrate-binding protein [Microbacterium agarici]TQO23235.1 glycine betaine/proline transport system substrate-binding protein [Microbacterium agarici]
MKKRILAVAAMATAAVLGVTGCSGDSGGSGGGSEDKGDITIGVFNGWPEGEAASYLWKSILEDKGYNVSLEYADAGPVFAGVASGDYDFALDGWLPLTHKKYFEQFEGEIVDLGAWNEDAKLTFAVNADAPIDSLEELAANADKFGNKIIGIEPGAGLTMTTKDAVIPEYGLEDMEYITSSTPAMLAELKKALDADENIVVTLWRPHWAYDAFDIKDLEDPKKALGEAESIHTFTSTGFEEDFSEVNEWLSNFKMDSDLLFSLENVMYNTDEEIKDYTPIVEDWIAENQDYVDGLTK